MAGERGSALVIALLVVVILALLGLSFMLAGETESKIARNQRDAAQAGFVAEGGVRMVKKWFDAPRGTPNAHLVPDITEMDRALRWVDDNNDGTYGPYTSASGGFNVYYRQTDDKPFEKPYRGTPDLSLLGIAGHPDIRISSSGTAAQQNFLNNLNNALYAGFPDPGNNQRARIRQIDVYGPPVLLIGGQRTRYGIATVEVTADIYQYYGTADQTRIASRTVKAVLNEAPYLGGPGGPLQSCVDINVTGSFGVHWGPTTAVTTMQLNNNIDQKLPSSVPYKPGGTFIERDMNGDGTFLCTGGVGTAPDDMNCDGILDFDNWLSNPNNTEDPWLKFMSEGAITSTQIPNTCGTTPNCQPLPFFQSGRSPMIYDADKDHSNIVTNVSTGLCPVYDYDFWKGVAVSGGENIYYYSYSGGGNFRLFGQPPDVDFVTAVTGRSGLFFFDTTDSKAPHDAAGNKAQPYVNLTPEVHLSGGNSITSGGFLYLNATNLWTSGSGGVLFQRNLVAPGEPYIDANGNGKYDTNEWFITVNYPISVGGDYQKTGLHNTSIDGTVRKDPAVSGTYGNWAADINFEGVFVTSGTFRAEGNFIFFGSVVTKSGMPTNNNGGTPDFYWDERLTKDQWPPFDLNLPRTVITAWQTDL